MASIHSILKQYWGYATFRPLQEDIIHAVLSQNDCLALLPTGGGKSLCFQVPAMAKDGLCLVISPLIALMKDQVENLRRKNITAFSIHSGMSRREVVSTLRLASHSNCKLLYVSPERLETQVFKECLHSLGITLIAVDEAHCISQWGYDFRPSYLKIALLREELPQVPILALTASATAKVQEDICEKLLFRNHKVFRQSFARPNLSYSAFNVPVKINRIVDILAKVAGSGIVYCATRRRTRDISDLLNMNGIPSDYYHAGLPAEQRAEKQEAWLKERRRIMVCTSAFGMGIDKAEVRTVIHADMPDCLESYYQEAGRAGRDGKRSYAVLLYDDGELVELESSRAVRFPPVDRIREIYQALMNHLQIPAGSGEGSYYDMDIGEFTRRFDVPAIEAMSVLKTLEREQLLYFNEQVFVPAKLQVTAGKEQLYEFEKFHPDLEPLLKSLLRNYEGIIDQQTNISEKQLSAALRTPTDKVILQLRELQSHGIVNYLPQKERPLVYLMRNRVRTADLEIDQASYRQRKLDYESRVAAMIRFTKDTTICRSVMIGNYFDDADIGECGICDICTKKRRSALSADEFERIHADLQDTVRTQALSMKQIAEKMGSVPREKLTAVIRFLQSENKIRISEDGLISLK